MRYYETMRELEEAISIPTIGDAIKLGLPFMVENSTTLDSEALTNYIGLLDEYYDYEYCCKINDNHFVPLYDFGKNSGSSDDSFLYRCGLVYIIKLNLLPNQIKRALLNYIKKYINDDKEIEIGKRPYSIANDKMIFGFDDTQNILYTKKIYGTMADHYNQTIFPNILGGLYNIYEKEKDEVSIENLESLDENESVDSKLGLSGGKDTKNTLDKMRIIIDSNIPLMLHGKPGVGKSQRIREIDPNCVTLELNLCSIEELTGVVVYKDGETLKKKPEWFEKLIKMCEEDKDNPHVLFLDEITNAAPAIQQAAYSLIQERKLGSNWKLPDNVRLVAAGNSTKDSIAAQDMPEPLINRFAHLNVNVELDEWIEWAQKAKIHPAIISYIATKGVSALHSNSKYENITITPRSWEMASKQLDSSNDIQDLYSILGDAVTSDFICFCRIAGISKEEILSGKASKYDFLNADVATRCAIIRNLTNVTMDEFEKVRNFIKNGGEEVVALFETLWVSAGGKDEQERMEKVAEIRSEDELDEMNAQNLDL